MSLQDILGAFAVENKFRGKKGPLSVALVITEQAKSKTFPLDVNEFLAESGTQVAGLGRASVQAVLNRNGITKVLAKEGGRTSRGSVPNMRLYVPLLNQLHADGLLDLAEAEKFWIALAHEYFSAKPFTLRLDAHIGIRAVVRNLMEQASNRQKTDAGTMFVGTVMQHLVGAKLDIVLGPDSGIEHHNANESDQDPSRTGDFDIGDASIHVTNAPSDALIAKCKENLTAGRKPLIVTGRKGTIAAEVLAENAGIVDQIDIIEFEQFIATNVWELSRFSRDNRRVKIHEIITRYNEVIDEVETDPSLKIELAAGK